MSVYMNCDKSAPGAKWVPLSKYQATLTVFLPYSKPGEPEYQGPTVRACIDDEGGDGFYMNETYKDRVLYLREQNGYDDSDFYAVCWDDQQNKPVEVCYATTRGWTYNCNAWVDATPEILAKYKEYCNKVAADERKRKADIEARTPGKGKRVRVILGRKVPQGTTGEVFWVGVDKYSYSYYTRTYLKKRIGFKDAHGNVHYTAMDNVEVIAE